MNIADIIFATLEMAITLPIVVGNILVIVAIRQTPRLQTNTNQFVISLSLADLSLGIGMPFHASWYVLEVMRTSKYVCLLRLSLAMTSCAASILNLLLISIDRYVAVLHPLHYPSLVTPSRVLGLLVGVWVYSGLLGALIFPTEQWSLETGCALIYSNSRVYILVAGSIQFSLILGAMYILYARILIVAYGHAKKIHALVGGGVPPRVPDVSKTKASTSDATGGATSESGNGSERVTRTGNAKDNSNSTTSTGSSRTGGKSQQPTKGSISLKELKSTKTLVLVMGAFTLCWAPYFSSCLLASTFNVTIPGMVAQVTLLLGLINSTLNPLIYAWRSADFRRAFRKILGCACAEVPAEETSGMTVSVTLD